MLRLCTVLFMWTTTAMAENSQAFDRVFADMAAAPPGFATIAGFAFGDAAPHIVVAGPRAKNDPTPVPVNADWHIGSITKTFTAALVMQQVEAGMLDLDAPIGTYLQGYGTEMDPTWQALTLRQLLSHTAGLIANPGQRVLWKDRGTDPRAARLSLMRDYWGAQVPKGPGTFAYSNMGYVLTGLILEEVTDTAWEDLVLRDIASPLGLASVGHGPPAGDTAPLGHRSLLGVTRAMPADRKGADNPAWLGPAGRLHMSMADLIRWGQAQHAACAGATGAILSQSSCRTLRTVVADDYALGWIIQDRAGGQIIWHNGSNSMWYAVLVLLPEHDLTVAIARNRYDPRRIDIALQALVASLTQKNDRWREPRHPLGQLFPRTCMYRWAPDNKAKTLSEPAPSDLLKATGIVPGI